MRLQHDIDNLIGNSGLGELLLKNQHFPKAGISVQIPITNPYFETQVVPQRLYRFKVVQGDRRAIIRMGEGEWTWDNVSFVSNTDDVYADVILKF